MTLKLLQQFSHLALIPGSPNFLPSSQVWGLECHRILGVVDLLQILVKNRKREGTASHHTIGGPHEVRSFDRVMQEHRGLQMRQSGGDGSALGCYGAQCQRGSFVL